MANLTEKQPAEGGQAEETNASPAFHQDKANTYKFEEHPTVTVRKPDVALGEVKKLWSRLGRENEIPEKLLRPLLGFVTEHHLNIQYYQDQLRKRRCRRFCLFVGSCVLLVLVPVLIANMHSERSWDKVAIAQVTALLTGLIAVHRTVSSWMDQRNLVSLFWNAASDLKQALYTFEGKWRGMTREQGFAEALREGTAAAREVVIAEQKQFFSTTAYPSVNLLNVLRASTTDVQDLMTKYGVKPSEVETNLKEIRQRSHLANVLHSLIEKQIDELKNANDTERNAIEAALKDSLRELNETRKAIVKLEAKDLRLSI